MPDTLGPVNGARDVACFNCLNSRKVDAFEPREGGGFHHQSRCAKGLRQPDAERGVDSDEIMMRCPEVSPSVGFQIGGYVSHTWFENGGDGGCLDLVIASDGEFPTDGEGMRFHLCDWRQVEEWVAFWGKELRRRGWVVDDDR